MTTSETVPEFDRRSALRKLLAGTGVVLAAPVITSFNAPAQAAILSAAANAFQFNRQDPSAFAPGPMVTVASSAGVCNPGGFASANQTDGSEGHVMLVNTADHSTGSYTGTINLPAGCNFVVGSFSSDVAAEGFPTNPSAGVTCGLVTLISLSPNGQSATFQMDFDENPADPIRRITVRAVATCD